MEEGIFKTIKSFLFSNLNKQFLVFMFFLFLSAIFWLIITLNETYEKELKIPVTVSNIPKNVVLTSTPMDTLRVTVRDKGWMMFSYMYSENRPMLKVNFKSYDRGNGGGAASNSELKRLLEQVLESSSKVISVKPEKFDFFYNNGERKRVPVRWAGRVIPEQLYFISHVTYSHDSVEVYASKEKLDSIHVVYSEPLNYVGFRDTLTVTCKLSHASDVKVVPERIGISFHTDVLTEESISVPIQCINLPDGKVLRTFPAKIKVHFVAGVSRIRTLKPEDFSVIADYQEITQNPSDKCTLYLQKIPEGISRATLSSKQVDYLIEEE